MGLKYYLILRPINGDKTLLSIKFANKLCIHSGSVILYYFLQPIDSDIDVYKHGDTSGFISVHWYCSNIVFARDERLSCANKLCIHT